MSSLLRLVITSPESANNLKTICDLSKGDHNSVISLEQYFGSIAGGIHNASIEAKMGCVNASGSISFTGLPVANETCIIGNVTFTAKTSGATGNQFNIGADATATALNLKNAINASSNLSGIISASSSLGVVTLLANVPGLMGNALQLSEALTNATATAFASGSNGTSYSINRA